MNNEDLMKWCEDRFYAPNTGEAQKLQLAQTIAVCIQTRVIKQILIDMPKKD